MINTLLANAVGFLNGLFALVLIFGGAIVGDYAEREGVFPVGMNGAILGLVIGFIVAIVVCGLLAVFISMRNELVSIRRILEEQNELVSIRHRSEGTYKDGEPDGPWVDHYDNGQLKDEGTFKNGEKDGPWVSYWENGQLLAEGTYKDGKEDGPWVFYNKDGTVNKEHTGTFKDGVVVK